MNADGSSRLLADSTSHSADRDTRLEWLKARLVHHRPEEIVDFQLLLEQAKRRTSEWNQAETAARLPRLSRAFPLTDRAERDRCGREAFERLLADRCQTEQEFFAELGLRFPRA